MNISFQLNERMATSADQLRTHNSKDTLPSVRTAAVSKQRRQAFCACQNTVNSSFQRSKYDCMRITIQF